MIPEELQLYQKMYALLCGGASDALDALENGEIAKAEALLQTALHQAEEQYLDNPCLKSKFSLDTHSKP